MAMYEFPPSNKWYALDPKTYKVLGWARTLERLRKRFPDGMKVLYSKQRIYKLKKLIKSEHHAPTK